MGESDTLERIVQIRLSRNHVSFVEVPIIPTTNVPTSKYVLTAEPLGMLTVPVRTNEDCPAGFAAAFAYILGIIDCNAAPMNITLTTPV